MVNNIFTIINPKPNNCLYIKGQMVYTKEFPDETKKYQSCIAVYGTNKTDIYRFDNKNLIYYKQTIDEVNGGYIKENLVYIPNKTVYKNIQKSYTNGNFSSTRLKDGVIIDSYYYENKPAKKLTGFKGFLEKIAWNVVNKKNGCERPFFNKIAGKIINKLRAVK